MRKIELGFDDVFDAALLERRPAFGADALKSAAEAIEAVRACKDAAIEEAVEKACGGRCKGLELSEAEIACAQAEVDEDFLDALSYSIDNIADFHERQRRESWFSTDVDGRLTGEKVVPLRRVGIYVDGAGASSAAAVLTSAIPALVAGVEEVVLCTPPRADGSLDPYTVAAATTIGVERIFKVGGAHAIAAMAYGTETVLKVDKVAGCGDACVAAAKKLVYGDVGVDAPCGPSETCVVADGNAVPAFVAMDLLAQAERAPEAASYLVTLGSDLLPDIEGCLEEYVGQAPAEKTLRAALGNVTAIACATLTQAFDAVNEIAPARLELAMASPIDLLGAIENAGSVFLGPWTPASAGAYVAGPGCASLLPGVALFSGALSVDDFVKKIPLVSYSYDAFEADAWSIEVLGRREGTWAACEAAGLRLDFMDYVQDEIVRGMRDVQEDSDACCAGHAHGGCGRRGEGGDETRGEAGGADGEGDARGAGGRAAKGGRRADHGKDASDG